MVKMEMHKMASSSCCSEEELNNEIRKKAQELWEKSGRKSGRDLENWVKAERIIKSKVC